MPRGLSLSLFLELRQLTDASPAARPEKKAATRSRGGGSGGLEASRGSEETAEEVFEAAFFFSPHSSSAPARKEESEERERERRAANDDSGEDSCSPELFLFARSLSRFLAISLFLCTVLWSSSSLSLSRANSRPERPWRRREDGKRGGNQNFRLIIDQSTSKKNRNHGRSRHRRRSRHRAVTRGRPRRGRR